MHSNLSSTPQFRKPQIHILTSLRFFAALGIFLLHANNHLLFQSELLNEFDFSKCVSFFFVLSGFVLYYSYADRVISLKRFYFSRLIRLWPLTALSIFLVLLFLPSHIYLPSGYGPTQSFLSFFVNILCLQSFVPIPNFYFGYNAVCWSISVELFFYLCFPFVRNLPYSKFFTLIALNSFLIILICAFLDLSEISVFSPSKLDIITLDGFAYINPIFRFPEFLFGVAAAKFFNIFWCERPKWMFLLFNTRFKYVSYCFHLTFIFYLLCAAFQRQSFFNGLSYSVYIVSNQLKSGFLFAIIIFLLSILDNPFLAFLKGKLFVFLGRISFSFYLLHQPIMILGSQLNGLELLGIQILQPTFSSVLLFSFLTSLGSYCVVEKSILMLKARYLAP